MILARFLAVSALAAVTLAPLSAMAKTCATDAECNPNQKCEVVGGSSSGCVACPPNADCPPCETKTTEERGCVDQPIACTTDKDCPAYLSCAVEDAPSVACPPCAAGAECPPCVAPAPSDKKICSFREKTCATNNDCAPGLECQPSSVDEDCAIATPACPPGGECPAGPAPECPPKPAPTNSCQFKIIDCKATTDCPSDFTCETYTETTCAGSSGTGSGSSGSTPGSSGGSNPSDPGPPKPGPAPTPAPADTPPDSCTSVTRQVCTPRGIGYGSYGEDSASGGSFGRPEAANDGSAQGTPKGGTPTTTGASTEAAAPAGSDDGCSVQRAGASEGSSWPALFVAAAAFFGLARGRRRTALAAAAGVSLCRSTARSPERA